MFIGFETVFNVTAFALFAQAWRCALAAVASGCRPVVATGGQNGCRPNFAVDRIPAEWKNKEPKEVRAELSKIRTAMSDIHTRVSDELYRHQQERSKDRER